MSNRWEWKEAHKGIRKQRIKIPINVQSIFTFRIRHSAVDLAFEFSSSSWSSLLSPFLHRKHRWRHKLLLLLLLPLLAVGLYVYKLSNKKICFFFISLKSEGKKMYDFSQYTRWTCALIHSHHFLSFVRFSSECFSVSGVALL